MCGEVGLPDLGLVRQINCTQFPAPRQHANLILHFPNQKSFSYRKVSKCSYVVNTVCFTLQKRLQKELAALQKDPPVGVKLDADKISKNLSE